MEVDSVPDPAPDSPRNLCEALCRRYGWRPEDFERRLFRKSLCLHARILMPFLGWFRSHTFNADWSLVESMGSARTVGEVEDRLAEFHDLNLIDRSRRRRWFRLRISSVRMREVVVPVLKSIVPLPASPAPAPSATAAVLPSTEGRRSVPLPPRRSTESNPPREMTSRGAAQRNVNVQEQLQKLEAENARLREIIAENAIELARLRGSKN